MPVDKVTSQVICSKTALNKKKNYCSAAEMSWHTKCCSANELLKIHHHDFNSCFQWKWIQWGKNHSQESFHSHNHNICQVNMIFWPNLAAPLLRWIPIWYGLEVFVFPARVETVSTHAIPEASFFLKKEKMKLPFYLGLVISGRLDTVNLQLYTAFNVESLLKCCILWFSRSEAFITLYYFLSPSQSAKPPDKHLKICVILTWRSRKSSQHAFVARARHTNQMLIAPTRQGTELHGGQLHLELLYIYMGETPGPRVCGGPFWGQYYNTVN